MWFFMTLTLHDALSETFYQMVYSLAETHLHRQPVTLYGRRGCLLKYVDVYIFLLAVLFLSTSYACNSQNIQATFIISPHFF